MTSKFDISALTLMKSNAFLFPEEDREKAIKDNIPPINIILLYVKKAVESTILKEKILIIQAGTGSGKSTLMIYKIFTLLQNELKSVKGTIAVTQPRVMNAISLANDSLPNFSGIEVGKNVGYITGFLTYSVLKNGINFMTVGILTQLLNNIYSQSDKNLSKEMIQNKIEKEEREFMKSFSVIIIDEVHDRSMEGDVAIALMKKFLERNYKNKDCPILILTSATFEPEKFSKYYFDAPIIKISGGTSKPINDHWLKNDLPSNPYEYVIEKLRDIMLEKIEESKELEKNILLFIYSPGAATELISKIEKLNLELDENNKGTYAVLILSRETYLANGKEYQLIFSPIENIQITLKNGKNVTPKRKIILSTPIAETGITFENLGFVFDLGFYISVEYAPIYDSMVIITKPCTKNMIMQRRGRVGRNKPGSFYPLYSKEVFDKLQENTFPAIIVSNIDMAILNLITSGNKEIKRGFDLIDSPTSFSIAESLEKLYLYGYIDKNYDPLLLANIAIKFSRITIESLRFLMEAVIEKCNMNIIIIMVCIINTKQSIKIPKYQPKKLKYDCEIIDTTFIILEFIKLLDIVIRKNSSFESLHNWCEKNELLFGNITQILSMREEIINGLVQSGFEISLLTENFLEFFEKNQKVFELEVKKIKKCL